MVTVVDRLILELETKLKNAKRIDEFKQKLDRVGLASNKAARVIDKTTGRFVRMSDATKLLNKNQFNLSKSLNKGLMSFQNFALGVGLSFLFTGMAIKNFFQNILTSIFRTFLLAQGESGALSERLNGLRARLEVIKFKLAEAFLESGLIDKWINRVEVLIQKFDDMNPAERAKLIDFIVKATIAGAVLMVVGQVLLGLIGVLTILKPLVLAVFGNPVVLAITAVIVSILLLSDKLGGLKNGFKAFGIFILRILAFVGDAIIEAMLGPINLVIMAINRVIRAKNKLFGGDTREIGLVGEGVFGGGLGARVDAMRDQLLLEGAQRREEQGGLLERLLGFGGGGTTNNIDVTVEGSVVAEADLQQTIQEQLNITNEFLNGSPQT